MLQDLKAATALLDFLQAWQTAFDCGVHLAITGNSRLLFLGIYVVFEGFGNGTGIAKKPSTVPGRRLMLF